MGWYNLVKKEAVKQPPTTRIWHAADLLIGIYAVKKEPSRFNWIRLGFALTGLIGNIIIAAGKRED